MHIVQKIVELKFEFPEVVITVLSIGLVIILLLLIIKWLKK